jgi:hypothetical protein
LASEKDTAANLWASRVEYCFNRDAELSADYNQKIGNGKWNHIMDQVHIGYTSWHGPQYNIMPKVERVKPEEARNGGYVFYEKNGVVVMEAEHYFECKTNDKTRWTVIPDLGRTLSGIALMPYTEQTNGASIRYRMKLNNNSDSIRVRIFFDSTMPFKKGGHNVAVSFDRCAEKTFNLNEELVWKNCYTKMYPTGAARMIETSTQLKLSHGKDNISTLLIHPLDPGVVIYKIVIDNGGYETTHLKMIESSHTRH